MLLDKLKEWDSQDLWNEENLTSINPDDLLKEVKTSYNKIYPIDYSLYTSIPDGIAGIIFSTAEEDSMIGKNPFYEKLLLQLMYMESRGLDNLYGRAIIAIIPAAQAAFEFERLLSLEPEYQFLLKVYNSYVEKSLSIFGSQISWLKGLENIDKEDLNKTIESLKGIIKPTEA